jgi:hypothetical protein
MRKKRERVKKKGKRMSKTMMRTMEMSDTITSPITTIPLKIETSLSAEEKTLKCHSNPRTRSHLRMKMSPRNST